MFFYLPNRHSSYRLFSHLHRHICIGFILIKLFILSLSNKYNMSVTRGPKDDDSWNLSVHFKSDILQIGIIF